MHDTCDTPRVANGPRKTPAHTLTIPEPTWQAVKHAAEQRHLSTSLMVSRILAAWVAQQADDADDVSTTS